jgi:hypothetical protein
VTECTSAGRGELLRLEAGSRDRGAVAAPLKLQMAAKELLGPKLEPEMRREPPPAASAEEAATPEMRGALKDTDLASAMRDSDRKLLM